MEPRPFIACGMYTFTPELRVAWGALLAKHHEFAGLTGDLPPIRYDTDETMLRDPAMSFGHTCGYPLMTRLRDAVVPVCVPEFDVPGCEGHRYSSRFVVPIDSDIDKLADCRGQVVAVNTTDSNSGMNVLRQALASIGAKPRFFERVELTGGHRYSLEAVASGRAQCGLGVICWPREGRKTACFFPRVLTMWPGSVLATRCAGNGVRLAPGTHDVAGE